MNIDPEALKKIQELEEDLFSYQVREDLLLEALHERESELRLAKAQIRSLMSAQKVDYQAA